MHPGFCKHLLFLWPVFLLVVFLACVPDRPAAGAFKTGRYPNLFSDLLNIPPERVQAKVDSAWHQLFHGDPDSQAVYFPVEDDMAYILDVLHWDVRSEGQSYGMMIAVQMDKKEEFDRLWKWARTYMQHPSGPRQGYFAWQLRTDGTVMDPNSASDGEEYIVTALFFASARWGDGEGIFDYRAEAQAILDAMLSKADSADEDSVVTNMFNREHKQVVFVPTGFADDITDPSYHLPAFYEIWALRADRENAFWKAAADTSRSFFRKALHPVTGLSPDYAHFDGTPADLWSSGHGDFRFDAFRTIMNIAVDHAWFEKDPWQAGACNRLQGFFRSKGMDRYVNQYTLDGKPLSRENSGALVAANAVASLAATDPGRVDFVKALWDQKVPDGKYRYYDGLLHMIALLHVSGNFRVYMPGSPADARK
ncbi:glycoside hydrolase [bacterium]|nr:glycoside hydrolase [bacterium]